ncbi:lamin tail domain-containing protein [Pseudolysinimonas sp.]|uniref:lamin tail domain-containing protein n=1 Tax=Pseudolysinimonas sp. TaxID=2680009 RepID=UPI00286B8409|nr:lamin tail domain-containing protein [Pseudolysinimonas sp.]
MLRLCVALLAVVLTVGGGVVAATPAAATLPKPNPDAVPTVLINEVASASAGSDADSFFELRNWGDQAVDLTGWEVFRCNLDGLRSNAGRSEGDLTGIVIAPGEIVTVSRVGMPGDARFLVGFDVTGFGLYVEDPDDRPVDLVAVFPNEPFMMDTECSPSGGNLPNVLDFAQGESWQRVAATGDPSRDWVVAPSTLGAPNATRSATRADSGVVVVELASMGPGGSGDDFLELRNEGSDVVDVSGWQLFRCTAEGRIRPDTRQLTIAEGTRLQPGEHWVAGGPDFTGDADASYGTSLADATSGVLLRDAQGALVDRVAITGIRDSACQEPKLPPILDAVAGESYQRTADGWVLAPRTPGDANATVADAVFDPEFGYPQGDGSPNPGVAISEVANDPSPDGLPAGWVPRNWIELGNYGDRPVDIGGWTAYRCTEDGPRAVDPQFRVPAGTVLEPGETFLAAQAGTAAAATADVTYDVALNLLGTGVWLADADGARVDSVGIYAQSIFDAANIALSPCTKGLALAVHLPDRLLEETFRRTRFTGTDADDFTTGRATPGVLDAIPWTDPTTRVALTPDPLDPVDEPELEELEGQPVEVLEGWAGSTDGAPLTVERGDDESTLDPASPGSIADDGYRYPYQRLVLNAAGLAPGSTVTWSGRGIGSTELQLSVWTGSQWRLLDAGQGDEVILSGDLDEGEIRDGRVSILVQNGPRTTPRIVDQRDAELEDPSNYDLAIAHITDTQYLSESYPDIYALMVSWIATNADARKIEFATHTGDIVENWVDPEQTDERARREFELASAIQSILDDAGVPNSVLPGNHDNKRGADHTLFNEFFGPDRYAGMPEYGGSIAPGDNRANFSTFEASGARFLMLSLPYAYGEEELVWAEQVVTTHPDHNVILSTHEHVMPLTLEGTAHRAGSNRWTSRGDELWERVIAPNRNVVVVLSGHFHGLGLLRTEDAGGIPGHDVVEILADYQEYRTHSGERATGFQRMLQLDLAGGVIAVDTFSLRLEESYGLDYDYRQFVPDTGSPATPSNVRPWRIVASGLQDRYTESDDEFLARVAFQYVKSVETLAVVASAPIASPQSSWPIGML